MSTIETLIVQIFDRKRQIIDQLKQHKLLYDQHLVSKLLIQGISPPPWLLPFDFPPSSSHFSALDKAGLISGLLHARPGPVAYCPVSQGLLYDKAVSAVNNYAADEVCAGNYAFSTGCDEDSSSVIPPCHVDDTEDRAGNILHVEANACELSYAPTSPEKQSFTRTCDTHPNQEQSLVKIQRSRSRQRALEIRKSAKTSGKSRLGISNDVSSPSQNKSCQGDEQVDAPRESLEPVRPFSLSSVPCYKGEASNKVRSPIDSGCLLSQFADNDVTQVYTGDSMKKEKNSSISVGRITRSRSVCGQSKSASLGSKAFEHVAQLDGSTALTESEKAFALPTEIYSWNGVRTCSVERSVDALDISQSRYMTSNKIDAGLSANNNCEGDEVNGLRASLELVKPVSVSNDICYNKEVSMKVTSPNCCAGYLTQFAHNEAKEVHGEENRETEKSDSIYAGRITRSSGFCQQFTGVSSGSKRQDYSEQLHGSRGYLESNEAFALPTRICSWEARTGTFSTDGSIDACNVSLSRDLGINNNVDILSGNSNSRGDEQLNGLRESPELVKTLSFTSKIEKEGASIKLTRMSSRCQLFKDAPSSSKTRGSSEHLSGSRELHGSYKISELPTEICSWKEADVGPCLIKESCNANDISLAKSADSKAKDGQTRDDDGEKRSGSSSTGRVNTSTSGCQSSSGLLVSGKTSGYGQRNNDIRESAKCVQKTASPMGILSEEETDTWNRKREVQHPEDSGRNIMITMTCGHKQTPASSLSIDHQILTGGPSGWSKKLEVETEADGSERCSASIIGGTVCGQDVDSSSGPLHANNKAKDSENSLQAGKTLEFSIVSPVIDRMDVDEVDLAMPDFESFGAHNFGDRFHYDEIPLLSNIMEPTCLHEHISGSACFSTPVSPLPAACRSSVPIGLSKNNNSNSSLGKQQCTSASLRTPSSPFPVACSLSLEPGIYSSVPNGLLENIDLRSNLLPVGSVLQRKSHSDLFSFPRNQFGQDFRKPFLSPIEMGSEIITSRSGGSEVRSGNPELTCFTIMEDPESSEEDVDDSRTGLEETDINMKSSNIKEPLCSITEKNDTSLVQDNAVEKSCVESTIKEFGVSEICDVNSRVNDMSHKRSKGTTQGKENNGFSIGGNSCKKNTKAHSSRFSKPKLSSRSSLRIRGQSMSEKEPKRNNIVSNVKSFVPLVQQKQAAATAPVKRDIKVKALEAAGAAKRLAEKKEDERRQKKEALKTERARLEQESLKQMELAKKLKEEAKKKREAENAVKKRQRAEEENKERERKRKRVEDARCEQKKAQEKIHAWREELRYGAEEQGTLEGKELNNKAQKEFDGETEASISSKPVNELVDSGTVRNNAGDGIPTSSNNIIIEHSLIGKVDSVVTAENSTPFLNKGDKPIRENSEEQSYDISPYQCSDDEEEEEDEMPNKKFIPSWASKSSVSLVLSSLRHLDPETLFPPGSFCSLDEVLLPKRLPPDPRK
ncbi:hypothetical protein RND81_09G064500 [Saponaria officinalis]|uniref:Inner centromere protein ARK-binding domain-containing protein n=1 Tax=Saponaria officinalis TaxID=3572 RepID=A0AAW1IIQ8_SAPOF